MLQHLSKRARAFIISQKGLTGFLKYFSIKNYLADIRKEANLLKALGLRVVDFDALVKKVTEAQGDQFAPLREANEALHALALRKIGREQEYEGFMAQTKE